MPRRLLILGSTGSIGRRALDVAADFPGELQVVGLSTNTQATLLAEQAARFRPEAVAICDPAAAKAARTHPALAATRILEGCSSLADLVRSTAPDLVLVATVGTAGFAPTLAAIEARATVALANKEVLVLAGELVMRAAREHSVAILPVDSEHAALQQCLGGAPAASLRRLVLTASGGPFRGRSAAELAVITPDDALRHPTWQMGPKISIDSATLMNKGFEVIEALHLFAVEPARVEVVVHPQSIIHSMAEFADGTVLAQLSQTDMYLPIQSALLHPHRRPNPLATLDFTRLGPLTFEAPDLDTFPCLTYAYEAAVRGGTCPAVLNAANEVAVHRFLAGAIPFPAIPQTIRRTLDAHREPPAPTLDDILAADAWARDFAARD